MIIKHITINTKCLDKSIEFYQTVLGLNVTRDLRNVAELPIVFLADEKLDVAVELIENEKDAYEGNGISIGFYAENLEDKHRLLSEKGYNPTPIISPNPEVKFFFIKDFNGLQIQFIK